MSSVSIKRVNGRRDRRAFIQFPFDLYRDNPNWIPPLRLDTSHLINPKKNAFFEHGAMELFLAYSESGQVVGRIAAILNGMHLKKYDDGVGFFGFFECINDAGVAAALFQAASEWLSERNLTVMRGPANPSLNDVAGLLVNGFHVPPAILMPYNADYYESLLAENGFHQVMKMWAYYTHTRLVDDKRLFRGAEIVRKRNPSLSIRTINMGRFEDEAHVLMDIYNDAWSENWGHVPMTEREFDQMAHEMKQIVLPELINIIEDEGQPVAFSASVPDMNYAFATLRSGRLLPSGVLKLLAFLKLNAIREIRMPLMGVRKKYQGRGLDAWLVADIAVRARKLGMLGCEMSWVLDSNPRLKKFLETLGSAVPKEYGLFEKKLS